LAYAPQNQLLPTLGQRAHLYSHLVRVTRKKLRLHHQLIL